VKSILLTLVMAMLPLTVASAEEKPTATEQIGSLEKMCTGSAKARAERHAAESLYVRLGGYDRILELTREVVRLHKQNDDIKHMFEHVDSEKLAKHVADFMAAGIGGTAKYTGRDLPTSHAHLELTDADFLSAGGDIIKAMQNLEYGQEEIDEVVCILVSLKDQVVLE
jgi:hemoglobin